MRPYRWVHQVGSFVQTARLFLRFQPPILHPSGSAYLGSKWIFAGNPPGGGQSQLYSTDGQSLTQIETQPGSASPGPQNIVKVGGQVYLISGQGTQRGIYKTDGVTAQVVATLNSFLPQGALPTLFSLSDNLFIFRSDNANKKIDFFRLDGQSPVEALTWQFPSNVTVPFNASAFNPQPVFNDGQHAYFTVQSNTGNSFLYEFDGSSFSQIIDSSIGPQSFTFRTAGNRVFVDVSLSSTRGAPSIRACEWSSEPPRCRTRSPHDV